MAKRSRNTSVNIKRKIAPAKESVIVDIYDSTTSTTLPHSSISYDTAISKLPSKTSCMANCSIANFELAAKKVKKSIKKNAGNRSSIPSKIKAKSKKKAAPLKIQIAGKFARKARMTMAVEKVAEKKNVNRKVIDKASMKNNAIKQSNTHAATKKLNKKRLIKESTIKQEVEAKEGGKKITAVTSPSKKASPIAKKVKEKIVIEVPAIVSSTDEQKSLEKEYVPGKAISKPAVAVHKKRRSSCKSNASKSSRLSTGSKNRKSC